MTLVSTPEFTKNEYPSVSPLVTDRRIVFPMARPVSGIVSGPAAASGTSSSSTIEAVTFVPAAMSTAAFTTLAVVGEGDGPVLVVPPLDEEFPVSMITPTNATTARNRPISRISRLLRFKVLSPRSHVTGGTNVASPEGRATIPKGQDH